MKVIHTSDWHLGARLHEVDRTAEHQAFLDWLCALMAQERPDALLLAGDVFDIKSPSPSVLTQYYGFLAQVVERNLCRQVIVIAGNHDSARLLAAPSDLLQALRIHVVAAADGDHPEREVVVVPDESGRPGLAVAAVPFLYEGELANFGSPETGAEAVREVRVRAGWARHCQAVLNAARTAAPGVPLVALGHGTLLRAAVSDGESECNRRIGGVEAYDPSPLAVADYVALGHLHLPQAVPGYEGRMYYSGSPLCMSFDEARREKSVNVVTWTAGAQPEIRLVPVPQTVALETLEGTPEAVSTQLSAGFGEGRRYLRIRLRDFAGLADPHWSALQKQVQEQHAVLIDREDMRPRKEESVGLKRFVGQALRRLEPADVARQKLGGSSQHYDSGQVEWLMRLFDLAQDDVRREMP